LAIIKNKLDLLLQDQDLTEKQYRLAEDMNRALTEVPGSIKSLLLAKIDNKQFDNTETISFDHLLDQSIAILRRTF
jgi:hypothetical protein